MVTESIRVGRCVDAYFALCREHGRKARTQWDADRRREADDLGSRPGKSPHRVARRIEATHQGCELMLEFWRGLASSLERHKTWTDAQRSLALDLLGVHPELRDAETPADPAEGDAFEARRALVAAEVARLTALRDGALAERDDEERALAESTIGAELTKPLQLMHRYEMAALAPPAVGLRKLDAARKARRADAPPVARAGAAPRRPVAAPPPGRRSRRRPGAGGPDGRGGPVAAPLPRPAAPARPPAPLNRHQRRARPALARQSGR